jgi:hypothetical protein
VSDISHKVRKILNTLKNNFLIDSNFSDIPHKSFESIPVANALIVNRQHESHCYTFKLALRRKSKIRRMTAAQTLTRLSVDHARENREAIDETQSLE